MDAVSIHFVVSDLLKYKENLFSIGYSHSSNPNTGWKTHSTAGVATGAVGTGAGITANKNWQTNNRPDYPRQQYHPQQTSYGQGHTPSVFKIDNSL